MHHTPPDHPPGYERMERQRERVIEFIDNGLRRIVKHHHHPHKTGKQNLPRDTLQEDMQEAPVLDLPLVRQGPLGMDITVSENNGMLAKQSPRDEYAVPREPWLKGAVMLWLRVFF